MTTVEHPPRQPDPGHGGPAEVPASLIEANVCVPALRAGLVVRDEALRRLHEGTAARLVSIAAPAGYGKTTVLVQWALSDGRPFAWLTLDERDNDPVLLVGHLRAAIDRAGVGTGPPPGAPKATPTSIWSAMVPELCGTVAGASVPFVLVLDDLHLLEPGEPLDVIGALARAIPPTSQLVLSGRAEPASIVTRVRAEGGLLELGPADLALTEPEAHELLATLGLDVPGEVAERLVRRSEGWAAGLYLGALGMQAAESVEALPVATVDRYVEDYLREEHLSRLPADEADFLVRSSILERLSAGLCDAALGRGDSHHMLEALERRYLFIVPLDRERTWYRYHELFRAALRRELDRAHPRSVAGLRRRAADWCEANGLSEDAMEYAIASGDADRMAHLFVSLAFPFYRSGRMATLDSWLCHFESPEAIRRYPAVAILGAWLHTLRGNAFQAERWADAAERAADDSVPAPDGSTSVLAWIAVLRGLLCREGPEAMREDAEVALRDLGPLSPFQAPARWLRANAILLRGDTRTADLELEDAAVAAEASGATFIGTNALAQRALLALDAGDIEAARALLLRGRSFLPHDAFQDYSAMALLLVAEARAALSGDPEAARASLAAAQRLRPSLSYAFAFYSVQVLTEMARAYLSLGDTNGARSVLLDASELLRHRPDLGTYADEVARLRGQIGTSGNPRSGWESSLTTAELRLLPLLTTHLTFREIGERLFVSRNTVKTQAISIYRKLGVSSRSEAVTRAAELGLVESPVRGGHGITLSG